MKRLGGEGELRSAVLFLAAVAEAREEPAARAELVSAPARRACARSRLGQRGR